MSSEPVQYTGIIRTLPYFGGIEKGEPKETMKRKAYRRMMRSFSLLEAGAGSIESVYVALAQKPKIEVLHMYLLIGGKVVVRANIAGYANGNGLDINCWDGSIRKPAYWAVLTSPVSWPREPVFMRGFQGFRYTEDLW